jgi:hypothetical protein
MSVSSSSSFNDTTQLPLYLVAFGTSQQAHFAFFLPRQATSAEGKLIHIGVGPKGGKKGQTSSAEQTKGTAELLCHDFNIAASAVKKAQRIPAASVSLRVLQAAANVVLNAGNTKKYNMLTRNCQTFVRLVAIDLEMKQHIPQGSVTWMDQRQTVSQFVHSVGVAAPNMYDHLEREMADHVRQLHEESRAGDRFTIE